MESNANNNNNNNNNGAGALPAHTSTGISGQAPPWGRLEKELSKLLEGRSSSRQERVMRLLRECKGGQGVVAVGARMIPPPPTSRSNIMAALHFVHGGAVRTLPDVPLALCMCPVPPPGNLATSTTGMSFGYACGGYDGVLRLFQASDGHRPGRKIVPAVGEDPSLVAKIPLQHRVCISSVAVLHGGGGEGGCGFEAAPLIAVACGNGAVELFSFTLVGTSDDLSENLLRPTSSAAEHSPPSAILQPTASTDSIAVIPWSSVSESPKRRVSGTDRADVTVEGRHDYPSLMARKQRGDRNELFLDEKSLSDGDMDSSNERSDRDTDDDDEEEDDDERLHGRRRRPPPQAPPARMESMILPDMASSDGGDSMCSAKSSRSPLDDDDDLEDAEDKSIVRSGADGGAGCSWRLESSGVYSPDGRSGSPGGRGTAAGINSIAFMSSSSSMKKTLVCGDRDGVITTVDVSRMSMSHDSSVSSSPFCSAIPIPFETSRNKNSSGGGVLVVLPLTSSPEMVAFSTKGGVVGCVDMRVEKVVMQYGGGGGEGFLPPNPSTNIATLLSTAGDALLAAGKRRTSKQLPPYYESTRGIYSLCPNGGAASATTWQQIVAGGEDGFLRLLDLRANSSSISSGGGGRRSYSSLVQAVDLGKPILSATAMPSVASAVQPYFAVSFMKDVVKVIRWPNACGSGGGFATTPTTPSLNAHVYAQVRGMHHGRLTTCSTLVVPSDGDATRGNCSIIRGSVNGIISEASFTQNQ